MIASDRKHRTTFIEQLRSSLLRGGRMTKVKGQTASYAPEAGATPTVLSRFACLLGSSVSAGTLSARGFAIALAAAAPLTLSATPALATSNCTETAAGSGIFDCTGAAVVTQTPTSAAGDDLIVTTTAPFSVITAAGNGFDLTNAAGDNNITFTDANASAITGAEDGIEARNFGTGLLTIITTGLVTGTAEDGIDARNGSFATPAGIGLIINASAAVMGEESGIDARNYGSGALLITTQAVTGTTGTGISASNAGTNLTINALAAVMGDAEGIFARNDGNGTLSITTRAVTSTNFDGIFALNNAGTSLTITTNGTVIGDNDGIDARNSGTAGLTINANANVTGETDQGINAYNSANDVSASLEINQAVGTITMGALNGIFADNFGGSLTINAYGTSIGTAEDGIFADNNVGTTDLTIIANIATGGDDGIDARNFGTGALSITTTGLITGTADDGIFARNGSAATPAAHSPSMRKAR